MSSYFSQVDSKITRAVVLKNPEGGDINISCSTGNIKINGLVPSAGGGATILPPDVNGTGDLTTQGNIRAQGDGTTTGKLEGEIVTATSGNITATSGDIITTAGNITAQGDGTTTGKLTGMNVTATSGDITATAGDVKVQAGNVEIDGTGNLFVNGTGEVKTVGGGNITAGLNGDVQTTAGDIVSGSRFIFDGADLYHRTNTPVVGTLTPYITYKQLPQLNANNTFTGANKFDDNITEFSKKVSVGERTVAGVFTENLALEPTGNLSSKTINNDTTIQCGDINCGNFSTNSVRAKKFNTRTTENNSVEGWSIEQAVPVAGSPSPLDNVLQVKGGAVGGVVTITDSAFSGSVPNIELDPRTTTIGGQITTTQYNVGEGTSGFQISQPKTGTNVNDLIIKAGAGTNPKTIFQDNSGSTTLMLLEQETGTNDGFLQVPAIEFGIGTLHNKIYQLQSGATNLNLNIKQATASSEIIFQDNVDNEIIRVQKTQVELGNTIPLLFGSYSFRPIQYIYSKSITIRDTPDTTNYTNMVFNALGSANQPTLGGKNVWTRVNDGATGISLYNNALEGFYKCSIKQTGDSSGSTPNFKGTEIIFDYILAASVQDTPDLTPPISYGYNTFPADRVGPPALSTTASVLIDHKQSLSSQSQPVFLNFSDPPAVGETMPILVTLTKLDF